MAEQAIVTCPECDKRFKGSPEMLGKKVRCPHCSEGFRVTSDVIHLPAGMKAAPQAKAKSEAIKEAKPKPKPAPEPKVAAAPAPPPPPPVEEDEDLVASDKPYVVDEEKLKARCPSCANPMLSEKAIVCVYCGYNTMTRTIGKTEKTFELTPGEHFLHLLPAMGAFLYGVLTLIGFSYFAIQLPKDVRGTWAWWLDSEALRMWGSIIALFQVFAAFYFSLFKFFYQPKPPEREKD